MWLSREIEEGAVSEAVRRCDPSVQPAHVLLALVANDDVYEAEFAGWWEIVEARMGPHGSAPEPPVFSLEARRYVEWCGTRASARRVADELFHDLGFADHDPPGDGERVVWVADVDGLFLDRDVAADEPDVGDESFDGGSGGDEFDRPEPVEIVLDETDTLERALDDLNDLVGLQEVKDAVRSLADTHRVNAERNRMGLPSVPLSPHLVFTGNPGTGKTTVARIVARIYRHLGLVAEGHLVETDRAGLVGGYLGQTALKTKGLIKRAIGGVLFIDEAYALVPAGTVQGEGDQYGDEAISVLLKQMEDRRGEFAVIVAGYRDEMERFVRRNPGLESRFQRRIDFPDYSTAALIEIFDGLARAHMIDLGSGVREALVAYLDAATPRLRQGNGRFMRNLFEEMYGRMARRALADGVIERHEITAFTIADVPSPDDPIDDVTSSTGMYL